MKNGQRKHPLLLGVLYGTAIYGVIVFIEVYGISDATVTMLIIPCILFIFVLISQMRNIASAKKEEDVDYCLNTYFIYKYITMPVGLIAAGIVGTLIVTIIWMIIKWLEEPLIIILIFILIFSTSSWFLTISLHVISTIIFKQILFNQLNYLFILRQ